MLVMEEQLLLQIGCPITNAIFFTLKTSNYYYAHSHILVRVLMKGRRHNIIFLGFILSSTPLLLIGLYKNFLVHASYLFPLASSKHIFAINLNKVFAHHLS